MDHAWRRPEQAPPVEAQIVSDGLTRMRAALTADAPVPDAEWAWFADRLRVDRPAGGEVVVRAGGSVSSAWFIVRGMMRIYKTVDGRDVNLGFDAEGGFCAEYASLLRRRPAMYSIAALEDSLLLRMTRDTIGLMYARHACWERVGRLAAERAYCHQIDKELTIRSQSPSSRYERIAGARPDLLRRIPQYHLASFLGVRPETLSRMRQRRSTSLGLDLDQ